MKHVSDISEDSALLRNALALSLKNLGGGVNLTPLEVFPKIYTLEREWSPDLFWLLRLSQVISFLKYSLDLVTLFRRYEHFLSKIEPSSRKKLLPKHPVLSALTDIQLKQGENVSPTFDPNVFPFFMQINLNENKYRTTAVCSSHNVSVIDHQRLSLLGLS